MTGDPSDPRLRELLDREEITALIHGYARSFDENDPAGVGALFAADATVDYGPEFATIVGGPDVIAATIAGGLERIFEATSHHVSNVEIGFDGPDDAHGLAYVYAWHRYRDGSPDGELWGRYRYRFTRTANGWRIASLLLQAAGAKDFHRATMHPIGRRSSAASGD